MSPPTYKDYYGILGVSKGADEKEIKSAYRKLARKYHPDVNPGDKSAESKFKEIQEAYDVLGDAEKRSQYDRFGDQWKAASRAGGWTGGAPQGGFQEFEYGGAGFNLNDLFESIFQGRRGGGRGGAPERGEDLEYAIELTLEEAARGVNKSLTLRVEDVCPKCGGSGAQRDAKGTFNLNQACPECRGYGRIQKSKQVEVKVPAGVHDGQRIRLSGEGAAGANGRKGDLFLLVRLKPHPQFELQGSDLYVDVPIPYTVAALGGEAAVRTLSGERTLPIPPGVQSGQKIRVSGQGLPGSGSRKAGDLYARVKVTVPKDLSDREKELLHELAKARGDKTRP